jgi:hypothetical protein
MTLRWLNRLLYGLWHVSPICCPVISPTNSGNIQHPFLWSQWNVDTPNKKTWFLRVFLQNWTEGNGFKTIVHPNDCSQPPSTYWCCPWTVSHHQKAFSPWWMPNLGTGRWVPLPMMEHTKLPWWDNPPESILHLRNSKRYISIHVHSSYIFQKITCPATWPTRDIVQVEEWIIHPTVASSHGALQHDTLLAFPNLNGWHPIDGTTGVILGRGIHDVIGSNHDA